MEIFVETIIYLLAILGIIFTSISFYEMFDLRKYINNTYRIYSKNSDDIERNVEIIVKIEGLNDIEEKDLVDILNSDNVNIKQISNSITIEREE